MTRLVTNDITHIGSTWADYEARLKQATGLRLWDLASRTAGAAKPIIERPLVGVTSISYGEGVISGFAAAVADICKHLGFPTLIAEAKNFQGWAELMARGAEVVLCSDDDYFGAFNLRDGRAAENSECTGLIYAECLAAMSGGLTGRTVHVIGAGPVGLAGGARAHALGAEVLLYDLKEEKIREAIQLYKKFQPGTAATWTEALKSGGLFLQAAPAAGVLPWGDMNAARSKAAHPAVPFIAPDGEAWAGNAWHDPLELGVAAMLAFAVKS